MKYTSEMANALSTRDIDGYTNRISILQTSFLGVYSADRMPQKILPGQTFIVNCCPSDQPGLHWVAIFKRSANVYEFFDSTGSRPDQYKDLQLPKSCKTILFRPKRIQAIGSETCGHYCIFFVYCKARKKSFQSMDSFFSKSLRENDENICIFLSTILQQ